MENLRRLKDTDILLEEVNKTLLNEAGFIQYKALVRVRYSDDPELHLGAEKVGELLRGAPGITRVNTAQLDKKAHTCIYKVRAISQKNARQCFMSFKRNCLEKFKGMILSVDIGAGSLETQRFVK